MTRTSEVYRGKPWSKDRRGIKHGYRSGLEDKIAKQIHKAGLAVVYETDKISYLVPERQAKYTPDFKLPKQGGFFYVETKGTVSYTHLTLPTIYSV